MEGALVIAPSSRSASPEEPRSEERMLAPLVQLGPNSSLGDLPLSDFGVAATTPSGLVGEEFRRHPDRPGVIVHRAPPDTDGEAAELISQHAFYKLLSRPFGLEIFWQRPIQVMLNALEIPALRLPSTTAITEGARQALSRPLNCVYEPILVLRPDGTARCLDMHVLLVAQTQLLHIAQMALVQSEKLASLGQLAAGVAHEINNPLAFVLNNVQVLRRDVTGAMAILDTYRQARPTLEKTEPALAAQAAGLEEKWDLPYLLGSLERLFDKTSEGILRVRDIVQNLRDFVRLDNAEISEVNFNDCVKSALEIINHEIKKKSIRIDTDFGQLPPIACHPRKINQVLINLLVNAAQSCADAGGLIAIRTRADGDSVVIEVEDNGSGIKPEHLPRIFDPFFTTKAVGQGTGLGLSVSYGIVRDHGGAITVDSQVGRGSTFTVRLPIGPTPGEH
jgi:signal transduction histidine kinase